MNLILLYSIIAAVLSEQQISAELIGGTVFGSNGLINKFIPTRPLLPTMTTIPTTATSSTTTTTIGLPQPSDPSEPSPFSISFDLNSLIPKDIKDFINGEIGAAGNATSSIINSLFGIANSIVGLAQSSLPNVSNLINGTGTNVDQLIEQLNQQRNKLENASISQLAKAYEDIQRANSTIAQSIEEMSVNAAAHFNKLRKSVSSLLPCIGEAYSSLVNASSAAATEGLNCLKSKVAEAADIGRNATNDIRNALNKITDVYKQIQQCQDIGSTFLISNLTTQASCLKQAAVDIRSETLLLPISLGQQVARAKFLIDSLQVHLIECTYPIQRVFSAEAVDSARQVLKNCSRIPTILQPGV